VQRAEVEAGLGSISATSAVRCDPTPLSSRMGRRSGLGAPRDVAPVRRRTYRSRLRQFEKCR